MKSSSYLTQIFKLNEGKDIENIAKSIGLDKDEIKYLRNELPIGQCIFKTNRPDFPYPFIIQIPKLPPPTVEFSEELNQAIINSLEWEPVKEPVKEPITASKEPLEELQKPRSLSPNANLLRPIIYLNPLNSITELYRRCKLAPSSGEHAKQELLKSKRAEEFSIAIEPGRGKQKKYLLLTNKSYEEMGLKPRAKTRGGAAHTWGCLLIAEYYKPHKSLIEVHYRELNAYIDVATKIDSKVIAHELCLSFSNLRENIEKGLKGNFDRFIIVFENASKRDKHKNLIKEYEGKNVEFLTLKNFIKGL